MMKVRLATPDEAEQCWNIRNQAIRHGCQNSYENTVIEAWTPEIMPQSFRRVMVSNPFFVVVGLDNRPFSTGFLDLSSASIEAVFTLPAFAGKGAAGMIIDAIKSEARERGFEHLTLSSTPNAQSFYEHHGFISLRESLYPSALAKTDLRCTDMAIQL